MLFDNSFFIFLQKEEINEKRKKLKFKERRKVENELLKKPTKIQ